MVLVVSPVFLMCHQAPWSPAAFKFSKNMSGRAGSPRPCAYGNERPAAPGGRRVEELSLLAEDSIFVKTGIFVTSSFFSSSIKAFIQKQDAVCHKKLFFRGSTVRVVRAHPEARLGSLP